MRSDFQVVLMWKNRNLPKVFKSKKKRNAFVVFQFSILKVYILISNLKFEKKLKTLKASIEMFLL